MRVAGGRRGGRRAAPSEVTLVDSYIVRHGTAWAYSTFIGRVEGTPEMSPGAETVDVAWVPVPDVRDDRILHPGFATAWRDGLRAKVEAQAIGPGDYADSQTASRGLMVEGWRVFALDDEGHMD